MVQSEKSEKTGNLYIIATPIGNLADISQRALEMLRKVSLVVAEDTRHSQRLLQHYGIQAELQSLHEHNERERTPLLIGRLLAGEDLALISDAGTPLLSDPGYVLVRAACESNITVSPIPGPSAITAALSASGLPTDRFLFAGFPPAKAAARRRVLQELSHASAVVVLFESTHRIQELLQDILDVMGPQRPLVLARELTKMHETFLRGSVQQLIDRLHADPNQRRGEFVVLLAPVEQTQSDTASAAENCLRILLAELPLKQAVRLAAGICGVKRNQLYDRALQISTGQNNPADEA